MEELYETIENYLHGNLPEKERQAFAKRLKQEPELEAEVNAFRLSEDIIEEGIAGRLRADFAAWDKGEDASQKAPARIVRLRSLRKMVAVAASLLLLSVATFLQWRSTQQQYNSDVLAANYHSADLGTTRSATNNTNELSGATEAMQTGDYPLAIQELLSVNDTSIYYSDAQFLLANAYYSNEELDLANVTLEPLLIANDPLLKEKAEWLNVLIALKEGKKNTSEFQLLLQQISTNTSHSFQPKAAELEATLDKFWVKWVD